MPSDSFVALRTGCALTAATAVKLLWCRIVGCTKLLSKHGALPFWLLKLQSSCRSSCKASTWVPLQRSRQLVRQRSNWRSSCLGRRNPAAFLDLGEKRYVTAFKGPDGAPAPAAASDSPAEAHAAGVVQPRPTQMVRPRAAGAVLSERGLAPLPRAVPTPGRPNSMNVPCTGTSSGCCTGSTGSTSQHFLPTPGCEAPALESVTTRSSSRTRGTGRLPIATADLAKHKEA